MREAHPVERAVGIGYYVSDADGVGGRLRERPEDFRVRELEAFDTHPPDADPGAYPFLVVRATLRGWDTNDFARRLSDELGISRERVDWAGTKDKDAVTTQLFSLRNVDADELPDVRDADVEVVGRAGRNIQFGDLAGNAFDIVVRDPEAPENASEITADLREFAGGGNGEDNADGDRDSQVGVPNFFGQQRFGSHRPVTHEVGLAVVRGEWREAVLSYVANPFETEPESTREARSFVAGEAEREDPDWGESLDVMPRRLRYERSMLHRLADGGADSDDDWRHALEAVPSNLQRLFVNAAQSYVFNRILSERLERGLPFHRPVPGDVCAFADTDAPEDVALPDPSRTQRVDADRVSVMERHCERGRAFVTAPLVGTETALAGGEPGDIERDVLEDVGVEPADFSLPGEFDSAGTRRAVLVRTDLELSAEPLAFSFSLPSGSYATVLLREYLKSGPLDL